MKNALTIPTEQYDKATLKLEEAKAVLSMCTECLTDRSDASVSLHVVHDLISDVQTALHSATSGSGKAVHHA